MVNRNTLETVAAVFSNWRNHRESPGTRIPQSLQIQAIELLESYSKSQVIKALKINHVMLKRWQQRHTDKSSSDFVRLPTEPLPGSFPSSLQVTVRNAHGGELHIAGMSMSQLTTLAKCFTSAGETL
jgi:hypothetical protein